MDTLRVWIFCHAGKYLFLNHFIVIIVILVIIIVIMIVMKIHHIQVFHGKEGVFNSNSKPILM